MSSMYCWRGSFVHPTEGHLGTIHIVYEPMVHVGLTHRSNPHPQMPEQVQHCWNHMGRHTVDKQRYPLTALLQMFKYAGEDCHK